MLAGSPSQPPAWPQGWWFYDQQLVAALVDSSVLSSRDSFHCGVRRMRRSGEQVRPAGSADNVRRVNAEPARWVGCSCPNSPLRLITTRSSQSADPLWRFRQERPKSRKDLHWPRPAPRRTWWSCDRQLAVALVVSSLFSTSSNAENKELSPEGVAWVALVEAAHADRSPRARPVSGTRRPSRDFRGSRGLRRGRHSTRRTGLHWLPPVPRHTWCHCGRQLAVALVVSLIFSASSNELRTMPSPERGCGLHPIENSPRRRITRHSAGH
jgi:hypothetical protein